MSEQVLRSGNAMERSRTRTIVQVAMLGAVAGVLMNFEFPINGYSVEFWVGQLREETPVRAEKNPLSWLPVTENYFDTTRFAGRGNLGCLLLELSAHGIPEKR